MEFTAALNEVPNKMGPHLFIHVLLLFLTLEESNPPYLSEKNLSNVWLGLEKI